MGDDLTKKGGTVGKLLSVRIIHKMALTTYFRAAKKKNCTINLTSFSVLFSNCPVPWNFTLTGIRTLTVGAVLAGCVPEWWRC